MRKFHMFALADDARDRWYTVTDIHDERGYRAVRDALARSYDVSISEPDIQIVDVDLLGDRCLELEFTERNGVPLDPADRERTLAHLRRQWGYDVELREVG
jgi:spore cortex formation protein SpoVR/YcgB (stage V sporulation)